jgi:chromosomal replication initiation ATPase DnaA
MIQLTFSLPGLTALGRSDFLVSDSNAAALAWIDRWPSWPTGALVMHGPADCGKTHLAHLWCERASAVILSGEILDDGEVARFAAEHRNRVAIDGADRAPERALLHLHNLCLGSGGYVLLIARRAPALWQIDLHDLRSRLHAALAVEIGPPDDALLGAVLVKHFADRQLSVTPELIAYLIRRIERSFAGAADIVARLDAAALREKSPITIALTRNVLMDQSFSPPSDRGVR